MQCGQVRRNRRALEKCHAVKYTLEIVGEQVGDTQPAGEASLQQTDRLRTLNEIGRVVSSTLDLGSLYETIYEQVSRVMDTTQFYIAVQAAKSGRIELLYHRESGTLVPNQQLPAVASMTTMVLERGTPLGFRTHQEYQEFVRQNGMPELSVGREQSEAKVWVPLNTGNRTIGVLSAQSPHPDAYSSDDVQTLSVIASQAAVAVENARLYARSQDNVRQMHALLHAAQMINSSLDLQTVLDSILIGMRDVMPYYWAAVLLPDSAKKHLDIVGSIGPLGEERWRDIHVPYGQGVTGVVFQTGEPLAVHNICRFPGYYAHPGLPAVRSAMAVPLKRGAAIIGVLDVEREETGAFSLDDLQLLTLFASQAAIAIENAGLYASQQNRVSDLQTIQSIVQQLTPLHEIPAIAALINQELKHLIDFHSCRLFSLDEDNGVLVPIHLGLDDSGAGNLGAGQGISGWIVQHGKSAIVSNTLDDPRAMSIPGTPRCEESVIGAPLNYEGRVRGVITLSKLGGNQFDENALRLLEIIATQTAIAFDRARLYNELRTDAITDPVTRLYNRRYLFERFREEQSRAVRNQHPLCALMLDIDKFKRINDQWGHDVGDSVLQALAEVIRGVVRAEDIVARHGGEEFSVLLPETEGEDAERVAERLREAIAGHGLPAEVGQVTVSVGMAMVRGEDAGMEVFTRADQAMYAVKHAGGNRVCVAEDHGFRFH